MVAYVVLGDVAVEQRAEIAQPVQGGDALRDPVGLQRRHRREGQPQLREVADEGGVVPGAQPGVEALQEVGLLPGRLARSQQQATEETDGLLRGDGAGEVARHHDGQRLVVDPADRGAEPRGGAAHERHVVLVAQVLDHRPVEAGVELLPRLAHQQLTQPHQRPGGIGRRALLAAELAAEEDRPLVRRAQQRRQLVELTCLERLPRLPEQPELGRSGGHPGEGLVDRDPRADQVEGVVDAVVEPDHAGLGQQGDGRSGVAALARGAVLVEQLRELRRDRLGQRRAEHAGLHQRPLDRRRPVVVPALLEPAETGAVDEVGAGGPGRERDAEQGQAVQQPAGLAVRSTAVDVEAAHLPVGGIDLEPLHLQPGQGVGHDRRRAGTGRYDTHAGAGQHPAGSGAHQRALDLDLALDEAAEDRVEQVAAQRRTAVAQLGELERLPERRRHRGHGHRHPEARAQLAADVEQRDQGGRDARIGAVVAQVLPQQLVPRGAGHAGRVAVEPVQPLEGVADQGRVGGHPGQPDLRPLRGRRHQVGQHHGMEAADHHQHRAVTGLALRQGSADVVGHLGLAGDRALGGEHRVGVVAPREEAVRRDGGDVLLTGLLPGLEEPLPQVFLVVAAEPLGEQLQPPAVLEVVLVEERASAVGGSPGPLDRVLLREVEVDEPGRDAVLGGVAQRHQLGRVVAERVVGTGPDLGLVALGLAGEPGVDRQRHRRLGVGQQRDQRVEGPRPLDQYRTRAQVGDRAAHVQGARGTVVPHGQHHQLVSQQPTGELADVRRGDHRLSGRARGARRADDSTGCCAWPAAWPPRRSSGAASCRPPGCP